MQHSLYGFMNLHDYCCPPGAEQQEEAVPLTHALLAPQETIAGFIAGEHSSRTTHRTLHNGVTPFQPSHAPSLPPSLTHPLTTSLTATLRLGTPFSPSRHCRTSGERSSRRRGGHAPAAPPPRRVGCVRLMRHHRAATCRRSHAPLSARHGCRQRRRRLAWVPRAVLAAVRGVSGLA